MSQASRFSRGMLPRCGALILLLAAGPATFTAGARVELVSRVDPGGFSDTGAGYGPVIYPPSLSRDGRYVAFASPANNLVPGQVDRNASRQGQGSNDIFLYDRVARTTALVSHAADSPTVTGNDESGGPVISADGRFVAFVSQSTNLASGLPEFSAQVRLFLYDRVTGGLTLVSSSEALESEGCGGCGVRQVAISADGRFVAFTSGAPDVVPGQPADLLLPVFLYDRTTGRTVLISQTGTPPPQGFGATRSFSMSADGRFIAFDEGARSASDRLGLGSVYLYDRLSSTATRIGPGSDPVISADGGSVGFFSVDSRVVSGETDANGPGTDVFLYSRATGSTILVSHAAGRPTTTGNAGAAPPNVFPRSITLQLSADGRFVAFISHATNLVEREAATANGQFLYLWDRSSGLLSLVSRKADSRTIPTNLTTSAAMSDDGRFITFASGSTDVVPGQIERNYGEDVFLFDRASGKTVLASSRNGTPRATGSDHSYPPVISDDGSRVAFYTEASDLAAGVRDLNNSNDLALYDVAQRSVSLATLHAPGLASVTPDVEHFLRGLSQDGRWVLFEGGATNLVPGQVDGNGGQSDVFLYDHATRTVRLASHASASPVRTGNSPSYQAALSADGHYAVFSSSATDLDPSVKPVPDPRRWFNVYLFDRVTGKTTAVSRSVLQPGFLGNGDSGRPAISPDGRWVAFLGYATNLLPGGSANAGGLYLYDRDTGALTRSSFAGLPVAFSADGRWLVLSTRADVYLYDRVTGAAVLASRKPDGSPGGAYADEKPALSADGRWLAFSSFANDLAATPGSGGLNVYLFDRETGAVTLAGGSSRVFRSRRPALSADGRWLAFLSDAEALVPGFANPDHRDQVYLLDRDTGALTPVTWPALAPGQATGGSGGLVITPDGRYLTFQGSYTDLAPGLSGLQSGIYQYDRTSGTVSFLAAIDARSLLTGADGRNVAFDSADTLMPRDFNGARVEVYLFSRP
jgi:Tol biopolymer transport system component